MLTFSSVFFATGVLNMGAPPADADDTARPDLRGIVRSVDEKPVASAHVYIYTAGVRTGTSSFCPSCYPDCGKSTQTSDDGQFVIESLDPDLIFRVLVVADGFEPAFVTKVDPVSAAMSATLKPIDPSHLQPGHAIRGRVLDAANDPVVGATVSLQAIARPNGGKCYGCQDDLEPLAITNQRGEFAFTSSNTGVVIDLKIEARGMATRLFADLPQSDEPRVLTMGAGVLVRGRLLKDGQPLPNAEIGLVQTQRWAEKYIGDYTIGTDGEGRFELPNVAPDDVYYIYGKMNSLRGIGSIPVREIRVGGDETEQDVGDLPVEPGHSFAGRVVLSDGNPIPPHTRITFGRENAWDVQIIELDDEGRFDARDLPKEGYGLSVRVKGYHISQKNPHLDRLNLLSIIGTVDRDISDFVLILDPGDPVVPNFEEVREFDQRGLRDTPFRSATLDSP